MIINICKDYEIGKVEYFSINEQLCNGQNIYKWYINVSYKDNWTDDPARIFNETSYDDEIASLLGIDIIEYTYHIAKNTNAQLRKRSNNKFELYWETERDVKEAVNWIESILLMNKLEK